MGAGARYFGAVWGTGTRMPTPLECDVDDGGGHKSKTVEQLSAGFFPTGAESRTARDADETRMRCAAPPQRAGGAPERRRRGLRASAC